MGTAATLVVVLLVALSGCAGLVPGGGEPTASQPAPRETPEPPPGVDADGVERVSGLLAAHRRALVDGGFVLETATTRRSPAGPNTTTRRTVVAAPDLAAHRHEVTEVLDDGRTVVRQRWTDGNTAARRVVEEGTVAGRGQYDPADAAALTRVNRLRWFLRHGDFSVTATGGRGGTARHLLRAEGPLATRSDGERGHLSVRAVVTPEGRIESLVATVTHPVDDGPGVRVESYRYRLRAVGDVTVSRPAWAPGREPDDP